MKKIKCLVADDEELSREILERYISQVDRLQLVATCKNGIEVFNVLKTFSVDLIFLDIQMPLLTGIELLKSLKTSPSIIFTTAYREYALEGYELNILDYLLKPISFERFLRAIDKYENSTAALHLQQAVPSLTDPSELRKFVTIKEGRKNRIIPLSEILFIESIKDRVKIKTIHQEILTYQSLSEIEQQLPSEHFLRIHRSFIVALEKITSFTTSAVEVGGNELPIGNYYQKEVVRTLSAEK